MTDEPGWMKPLNFYQCEGRLDKIFECFAGSSGVRIPGRGKCSLRIIVVDVRANYQLYLSLSINFTLNVLALTQLYPFDLLTYLCRLNLTEVFVRAIGVFNAIPQTSDAFFMYGFCLEYTAIVSL